MSPASSTPVPVSARCLVERFDLDGVDLRSPQRGFRVSLELFAVKVDRASAGSDLEGGLGVGLAILDMAVGDWAYGQLGLADVTATYVRGRKEAEDVGEVDRIIGRDAH